MKRILAGFLFLTAILLTAPPIAMGKTCTKNADCDDQKPCTADYCSGGTCMYMASCYGAKADASPPEDPIDQVKLTACLAVCKDELCWSASCTNQGECFKMATCVHTSKDPPIVLKPIVLTPCLPLNCDDGNFCTKDSCIAGQCLHKNTCIIFPLPKKCVADSECDDGKYCNGKELCQNGTCVTSPLAACPALNDPCKENLCDETIKSCAASVKPGCDVSPESPQGNPTDNPTGSASGTNIPPLPSSPNSACAPVPLDDGDPCTEDLCDPATGTVTHKPISDCVAPLGDRPAFPLNNIESDRERGGPSCSLRKEVPSP